jgi:hypothetical protein
MTVTTESIKFYPKSHRYKNTETGEWIPSVTTIAGILDKPFLMEWAAREASHRAVLETLELGDNITDETVLGCMEVGRAEPRTQRDHGRLVGSDVHERIRATLTDTERDPKVEYGGIEADLAFEAFEEWHKEMVADGLEVLEVERIVVDPLGRFVGTFDLLCRTRTTGLTLVDFKTTNKSESNPLGLYPEYVLQLIAYGGAIQATPELEHGEPDTYIGVGLGKDGSLSQWELDKIADGETLDKAMDTFLSLCDIYRPYRDITNIVNAMNRARKKELEEATNV